MEWLLVYQTAGAVLFGYIAWLVGKELVVVVADLYEVYKISKETTKRKKMLKGLKQWKM